MQGTEKLDRELLDTLGLCGGLVREGCHVAGLGYEVCEPVAGCHVVLVDDVILTGVTLGMVAACLQEAGAASVTAAVAARTRRP